MSNSVRSPRVLGLLVALAAALLWSAGPGSGAALAAAPVCVDSSYTVDNASSLTVAITDNCSDADGDTMSGAATDFPDHGSIVPDGAGGAIYTPSSGYVGPDSFSYYAIANGEQSDPVTVSITVTGVAGNQPPQCFGPTSLQAYEGQVTPFFPPCFDPDTPPNELVATLVGDATHGDVVLGASSTYTADAGYVGPDSFSFKLSDGTSDSETVVVNVDVLDYPEGNLPPTCPESHAYVEQGSSIVLRANCVDPDGDSIFYNLAPPSVQHGTLDQFTSTSVRYTPAAGYTGPDRLGYSADDPFHPPVVFAVDITVLPNGAPCCETAPEATPAEPYAAAVDSPVEGPIYIDTRATTDSFPAPTGYTYLDQEYDITTPNATDPADPLRFTFKLDSSKLEEPEPDLDPEDVVLHRNGVAVTASCPAVEGRIDTWWPCIEDREVQADGDLWVTVLTMQASVYNFGVADEPEAFDFSGYFAPVNNRPTVNSAKAGQAIPVKFSLGGDQGLDILAVGHPKSQSVPCGSTADVDGIESTANPGASALSYHAASDTYTYVWKTDKGWANTCRQLVVKFADEAGSTYRADFQFKR